jgi:hypothetical protein
MRRLVLLAPAACRGCKAKPPSKAESRVMWSIVTFIRRLPKAGSLGEPEMYSH